MYFFKTWLASISNFKVQVLHALYIEVQRGFTFSIKMDLSKNCLPLPYCQAETQKKDTVVSYTASRFVVVAGPNHIRANSIFYIKSVQSSAKSTEFKESNASSPPHPNKPMVFYIRLSLSTFRWMYDINRGQTHRHCCVLSSGHMCGFDHSDRMNSSDTELSHYTHEHVKTELVCVMRSLMECLIVFVNFLLFTDISRKVS